MPQFTTTTQPNQVPISEAEFSLETAYGSVKQTSDDRDLNDIIRDAKDEKAEQTALELGEPRNSLTPTSSSDTSTQPIV